MLAAARYGHVEVLREVINKYGCDKNALHEVCFNVLCCAYVNECFMCFVLVCVCVCVCVCVS